MGDAVSHEFSCSFEGSWNYTVIEFQFLGLVIVILCFGAIGNLQIFHVFFIFDERFLFFFSGTVDFGWFEHEGFHEGLWAMIDGVLALLYDVGSGLVVAASLIVEAGVGR